MKKLIGIICVCIMAGLCACSGEAQSSAQPASVSSTAAESAPAVSETNGNEAPETNAPEETSETVAKETAAPETQAPETEDDMTMSQKNVIRAAQEYLEYSAFSRAGLFTQLTSEYGSQYPEEDAEFALSYLDENDLVDWNEQAVRSAQDYLEYSAFSRTGLIDQLSSEYGSQFTQEQAEYAVDHLEKNNLVDWNEQAVRAAQEYLEYSAFSRAELIEQLSSEYGSQFTQEQAEYAAGEVGY